MSEHEVTASGRGWTRSPAVPNARWATALATLLLTTIIVTGLAFGVLARPDTPQPVDPLDVVYVLSFFVFPAVGWLIAFKLPRNPLGWIYLAFSALALVGTGLELVAPLQAQAGNYAAAAALIQLGGWLYGLAILLILGPSVLLFPDGRLPGRRWRFVLWVSFALTLLNLVFQLFGPPAVCVEPVWEGGVLIECAQHVDNPLHLPIVEPLNTNLGSMVEALLGLTVLLSVVGLFVRYRRSAVDVRQQIKWVAFVAAVGIVPLILSSAAQQVIGFTTLERINTILLMFITIGLPIAIGFAIFKYRLYDIDRIISRTAAYAIVIGVLAAIFVATIAVTQQLLPVESELGIVVSTLVMAAFFNPVRLRVQRAVDRRFNRSRFDAQQVVDEFSSHLRDDVELENMQAALLNAAQETMHPSHLSLWIRESQSGQD